MLQKKRKKCGENQRQWPRDKAYKCACIDRLSKLQYKYIYIREHLLQLFLGGVYLHSYDFFSWNKQWGRGEKFILPLRESLSQGWSTQKSLTRMVHIQLSWAACMSSK